MEAGTDPAPLSVNKLAAAAVFGGLKDRRPSGQAGAAGKGPAGDGIETLRQSARYFWCGRTLSSTRSVAPGDTIREELGVAVVGAGMLEVGGICLKWVQDGGGFPVSHEVECPAVLIDVRERAA